MTPWDDSQPYQRRFIELMARLRFDPMEGVQAETWESIMVRESVRWLTEHLPRHKHEADLKVALEALRATLQ